MRRRDVMFIVMIMMVMVHGSWLMCCRSSSGGRRLRAALAGFVESESLGATVRAIVKLAKIHHNIAYFTLIIAHRAAASCHLPRRSSEIQSQNSSDFFHNMICMYYR